VRVLRVRIDARIWPPPAGTDRWIADLPIADQVLDAAVACLSEAADERVSVEPALRVVGEVAGMDDATAVRVVIRRARRMRGVADPPV
jgi:hypothetical protein